MVTPSRYFLTAAVLLLLGAAAMPVALGAYALSATTPGPTAVAVGVWAIFVLLVAVGGPIVLTLAGLLSLLLRRDGP